jgi:hypothetical protein
LVDVRSAARLSCATTLVVALCLAVLAPASASATAAAATCGERELSQPFLAWHDHARYFLLPGGDLEPPTGWTLSSGARLVDGNVPFSSEATSGRSLFLPSGASARTASSCVDSDEPTMRFFVRNTGSLLSMLAVEARIRTTVLGITAETTLPLGAVLGTARTWQPSPPVLFALSANQLLGGTSTVDFRFTALGLGGKWQVDDVYVDPFKDR